MRVEGAGRVYFGTPQLQHPPEPDCLYWLPFVGNKKQRIVPRLRPSPYKLRQPSDRARVVLLLGNNHLDPRPSFVGFRVQETKLR